MTNALAKNTKDVVKANLLEYQIQQSVILNSAWISQQCEARYNAMYAWRWREDYWYNGTHDKFNP